MKTGLISDIHANIPALEAVLNDMPSVDSIVCAGDVIGYNPMPAECVGRIQDIATTTVQGIDLLPRLKSRESHHGISGRVSRP